MFERDTVLKIILILVTSVVTGVISFFVGSWNERQKSVLKRKDNVEFKRFELLHEAIFEALRLLDCYFSYQTWHQTIKSNATGNTLISLQSPTKQDATTAEFRSCHNKLILSCRNVHIVQLFLEITLPNRTDINAMEKLDDFRAMARKELEFGDDLVRDKNRTWFSTKFYKRPFVKG